MAEKEVLDPHGYPIEMDRPIVFDEGKLDPHTELSITEKASDLGLQGDGYYNVPSIYEGKIYNPQDPEHYETIKSYVQKQAAGGFRFPNFPSIEEAEKAAQARSEYFNQVKAEMLRDAVEKRRQELIIQMMQKPKQ
jgi:hypothetical protein